MRPLAFLAATLLAAACQRAESTAQQGDRAPSPAKSSKEQERGHHEVLPRRVSVISVPSGNASTKPLSPLR